MTEVLPASFYDRPAREVAPDLLGCVVEHGGVAVRLTEVEAYEGVDDPGSHAFRGPTPRTEVMFGPPGFLYVYFSYGMHHCMNLVCDGAGRASAVLLRAGEVVAGIDEARRRRTREGGRTPADRDLGRGPARLTKALAIDLSQGGSPVTGGGPLVVRRRVAAPSVVATGPRVGVSGDGGDGSRFPWRYWIEGDPSVSVYRPAVRRRRGA